jgi:hypothetical protein
VLDVFTIAHIATYRDLKNPTFVLGPRLVDYARHERKSGVAGSDSLSRGSGIWRRAFLNQSIHSAASSRCHHLRRPALHERSETIERLGEIVSGGGEAQAEMRGRIEAIAGS